jgi:hypothetical protein
MEGCKILARNSVQEKFQLGIQIQTCQITPVTKLVTALLLSCHENQNPCVKNKKKIIHSKYLQYSHLINIYYPMKHLTADIQSIFPRIFTQRKIQLIHQMIA